MSFLKKLFTKFGLLLGKNNKMTLFEIPEKNGSNSYAAINSNIKDIKKENFPFTLFIDLVTEEPIKDLNDNDYMDMQSIEDEIKNSFQKNEAILIGHVTKYSKREILFYTAKEYVPDDFLLKLLVKEYFNPEIVIGKDSEWTHVEAFLERI